MKEFKIIALKSKKKKGWVHETLLHTNNSLS